MGRTLLTLAVLVVSAAVLAPLSMPEIRTVQTTEKFIMGNRDPKADARKMALPEARRAVLEPAGTWLSSQSTVKDQALTVASSPADTGSPREEEAGAKQRVMALDDVKSAIKTLRGGDPSAAREKLDVILARDPDNLHAILIRARVLADLGRYADALVDIERALALEPNQARAHMGRGQLLIKTGDAEGALKSFAEAISLDPKNARGYYFAGMAHLKLNRPRIAYRFLDRACRMGDTKACEKTDEIAKQARAMQMHPRKITMPEK